MKISIVLGTRPEIIKFSPIIRECEQLNLEYFILHSGQHYSHNMDGIFFEQLQLPKPDYNLEIGSGSHAEQTGKMLIGIEKILKKEKPNIVLVEGDTNTTLAGALVASKLGVDVGHVEAGLRSYDRNMPEEINRILTDHGSNLLFAPTKDSKAKLIREGIPTNQIFVTGNTIVDAVNQNLGIANKAVEVFERVTCTPNGYFLATVHRQGNVDNKKRFIQILNGLKLVQKEFSVPIIYPIHPRAEKQLRLFGVTTEGLHLVEPLDYLAFLQLESRAKLILTDSGGVQEEACILGIPCVTLRDRTERPETLAVGSNVLAGTDPDKIIKCAKSMHQKSQKWRNPFGDGKAGKKIMQILVKRYG